MIPIRIRIDQIVSDGPLDRIGLDRALRAEMIRRMAAGAPQANLRRAAVSSQLPAEGGPLSSRVAHAVGKAVKP